MSDALKKARDEMMEQYQRQVVELNSTRMTINALSKLLGEPPVFSSTTDDESPRGFVPKRDQYYGRPLATAVREYLEMRREAATPEEIRAALEAGSFDFRALDWQPATMNRSLAMALSKNPGFIRLPSGAWGLRSKYPSIKASDDADARRAARSPKRKKRKTKKRSAASVSEPEEAE